MPGKGQTLSAEAIAKVKEGNIKNVLSRYKWNIVEPYLDISFEEGNSTKSKTFITLRNFREKLLSGDSSRDLKKQGVSKHLLQFFSNLCQGKILLTKDSFEKEYLSGQSLEEISDKYNVTREDLTFLRQLYNIDRLGATFIHRKLTEVPLTQRQKEIVYGSMLGDAKKTSPSSVGFGHCEFQKAYLFWKYIEMESVASKNSIKLYKSIDKKRGGTSFSWRFYTYANSDLEYIISQFYPIKEKIVNRKILDNLSDLSLAVWYMDDGMTDWANNKNVKSYLGVYDVNSDGDIDVFDLSSIWANKDG
jgi:hypothetical protein